MAFPADAETVRTNLVNVKVQAATARMSTGESIRLDYEDADDALAALRVSKWLRTHNGFVNGDFVARVYSGEWYDDRWSV